MKAFLAFTLFTLHSTTALSADCLTSDALKRLDRQYEDALRVVNLYTLFGLTLFSNAMHGRRRIV